MSEEDKKKLEEYQKIYREAKKRASQNANILVKYIQIYILKR